MSWNKVKIHQHGPLEDQPFEAQLNDAADQMAGQICTSCHGPINTYIPYQPEGLLLRNDALVKVHDIEPVIHVKIRGEEIRDYLMRKNNWTPAIIAGIEWKGLEKVLKPMAFHRRLTLLQLIHNWQNVGSQKQQSLESTEPPLPNETRVTTALREKYQRHVGQCPFHCGLNEDAMHYMQCPATKASNFCTQLIKKIQANLS